MSVYVRENIYNSPAVNYSYVRQEKFTQAKTVLFLAFILLITIGLNFSLSKGDAILSFMNKLTRVLMALFCVIGMILYSKSGYSFGKRYRSWLSFSCSALFLWIFYTLFFAREPEKSSLAFNGVFYLFVCYSFLFYLIESKRMLTDALVKFTIIFLTANYAAVIIFPSIAIHSDGNLVGLWRGMLMHKNTAGPVFAYVLFMGVYLLKNNYVKCGIFTIVFAAIFSFNAGSKTILFVEFIVIFIVQGAFYFKSNVIRSIVLLTPLSLISFITLTSVLNLDFADYLHKFNIPTDYTGRDKLWILAVDFIKDLEHYGLGFGSYFLTEEGEFYKANVNLELSWADNFHNAYLETYVSLGLTGFILAIIFFIYVPLRSIHKALKQGNDKSVVMLFTSFWLLLLHSATMESVFFGQFNPGWAIFVASIFALRRLALEKLPE